MFPSPDPRLTSSAEDLRPDPVFMAVRRAVGWFTTRLDAWRDDREDRREARAAVARANAIVREAVPVTSWADQSDRDDLAA